MSCECIDHGIEGSVYLSYVLFPIPVKIFYCLENVVYCGVSFSIVFILFTFLEILGTMPLIFRHFKNKIKWKSLLDRNHQQLISRREGRGVCSMGEAN